MAWNSGIAWPGNGTPGVPDAGGRPLTPPNFHTLKQVMDVMGHNPGSTNFPPGQFTVGGNLTPPAVLPDGGGRPTGQFIGGGNLTPPNPGINQNSGGFDWGSFAQNPANRDQLMAMIRSMFMQR